MATQRDLKASIFRLPQDLTEGLKTASVHRGEAVAVIVREIIREGLQHRGVIEAATPNSMRAPNPVGRAA